MLNFDNKQLEEIITKSRVSARRRFPLPLHQDNYSGPQLLINAIQPDSYIMPHKHYDEEIWMPIKGLVYLVTFEDNGDINECYILGKDNVVFAEVPKMTFHTGFAVEPDSVLYNISQGPFDPNKYKEFAKWAPKEEDTDKAREYLKDLKKRVLFQNFPLYQS